MNIFQLNTCIKQQIIKYILIILIIIISLKYIPNNLSLNFKEIYIITFIITISYYIIDIISPSINIYKINY